MVRWRRCLGTERWSQRIIGSTSFLPNRLGQRLPKPDLERLLARAAAGASEPRLEIANTNFVASFFDFYGNTQAVRRPWVNPAGEIRGTECAQGARRRFVKRTGRHLDRMGHPPHVAE